MLGKFQPNFQYYVKKIETQAKNGFLIKKRVALSNMIFLSALVKFSSKKYKAIYRKPLKLHE